MLMILYGKTDFFNKLDDSVLIKKCSKYWLQCSIRVLKLAAANLRGWHQKHIAAFTSNSEGLINKSVDI